jgi:hypothetical protein
MLPQPWGVWPHRLSKPLETSEPSAGGKQQSVATPEATRRWAHPPSLTCVSAGWLLGFITLAAVCFSAAEAQAERREGTASTSAAAPASITTAVAATTAGGLDAAQLSAGGYKFKKLQTLCKTHGLRKDGSAAQLTARLLRHHDTRPGRPLPPPDIRFAPWLQYRALARAASVALSGAGSLPHWTLRRLLRDMISGQRTLPPRFLKGCSPAEANASMDELELQLAAEGCVVYDGEDSEGDKASTAPSAAAAVIGEAVTEELLSIWAGQALSSSPVPQPQPQP